MYAVAENFSSKLPLVSNLEAVGSLVVLHDTYLQRIFLLISVVNYDRFFVPESISKSNSQDLPIMYTIIVDFIFSSFFKDQVM